MLPLLLTLAFADIAPRPRVGSICDLKTFSDRDLSCELCRGDFRDPTVCDKIFSERGWHRACKGPGSKKWNEVWCATEVSLSSTPHPAPPPPPPSLPFPFLSDPPPPDPPLPEPSPSRCSQTAVSASSWLATLAFVTLALRRRRQRGNAEAGRG